MSTSHQELGARLVKRYGTWFQDERALQEGRMTSHLYPYEQLSSPIQVNDVEIENRIVMGPTGNVSMADETGRPSAKMIQYFAERAKGGVGLTTSGLVPVAFAVDSSFTEPGGLAYLPRIDRSANKTEFTVAADLVMLATGMKPDDALYEACVKERVAPEIYNIGDSLGPAGIFEATKAGYAVGRSL